MEFLLPPGIPPLTFEDLESELVSYMHGEETSYSRDVIEYYLEHNERLRNAYKELNSLVSLLGHTPVVEPSKKFVRKVARALPKLKVETRISSRVQDIILHAGWGFEERVIFLFAYIKYRFKHKPSAMIAIFGCLLFVITTATMLPTLFSADKKNTTPFFVADSDDPEIREIFEKTPLEREIIRTPGKTQKNEVTLESVLNKNYRDDYDVPDYANKILERPPQKKDTSTNTVVSPKNYPTYSQLIGTGFSIKEKEQILPWFSKRKFSDVVRKISQKERLAIYSGLEWLSRQQQVDGSFRSNTKTDDDENPASEFTNSETSHFQEEFSNQDLILTSLTALSFITEGYASFSSVPKRLKRQSKKDYEEVLITFKRYQRITRKAINFIKNQQREDGFLSQKEKFSIVAHSIALLALIEDRNTCNNWRVRAAIVKGVETLKRYRNFDERLPFFDGGWGNIPDDNNSQLTPTFWALLALKSAANSGIDEISFDDELFTQVDNFLGKLKFSGGLIGESVASAFPEGYLRPTAAGLALESVLGLKRIYTSENIEVLQRLTTPEALPRWELSKNAPGGSYIDFEYWFFGSLAVAQAASAEPKEISALKTKWRSNLVDILTQKQMSDGKWLSVYPHTDWGDVYSTALAVMSLQNQYRYNFK